MLVEYEEDGLYRSPAAFYIPSSTPSLSITDHNDVTSLRLTKDANPTHDSS
jgi:hypothetical protein